MDYFDPFAKDSINKKCHRVRSWYLYEQFKSLEKNQLDATSLLKSKSYQNNILRQELKERRARRRFCDQYGLCRSESRLNSDRESISLSKENYFESACELHEDEELRDICNCDGSRTSKNYDDFNKECLSDSGSILSVVDNTQNFPKDVKQELEIVKQNIAQNINLQLETEKENVECLETFTRLNDEDALSRESGVEDEKDVDKNGKVIKKNKLETLLSFWSKLVVFAYNTSQLNHGNCYCHFSSQLLTAVLACDLLRRSLDRMCNILQSYVSPIKYASDPSSSDSTSCIRCFTKNKNSYSEKCNKTRRKFKHRCDDPWYKKICHPTHKNRRYSSEYKYSKYSSKNRLNERRGASEPWKSYGYNNVKNGNLSRKYTNFNKISGRFCNCHNLENIFNPILQVSRYIERILQDVDVTSSESYF